MCLAAILIKKTCYRVTFLYHESNRYRICDYCWTFITSITTSEGREQANAAFVVYSVFSDVVYIILL